MITGEELERRLRRVSQLRNLIITLRRAAYEAWERGESPYKPQIDIRSDYKYWRKLAQEKGLLPSSSDENEPEATDTGDLNPTRKCEMIKNTQSEERGGSGAMSTKELLEEALKLKAQDRFALVDSLIRSLDEPDKALDDLWPVEAEKRLQAWREGRLKGIPMEELFKEDS